MICSSNSMSFLFLLLPLPVLFSFPPFAYSHSVSSPSLLNPPSSSQHHCYWDERVALTLLFNATNGQLWHYPWNIHTDPCLDGGWMGVSCSLDGHVIEISLAERHLVGTLPLRFASRFPNLKVLNLGSNHLYGRLPPTFASLKETVVILDLSHNQFFGPVPPFLATFDKLQVLNLEANSFNQPFPRELLEIGEVRSNIYLYI